MNDNAPLLTRNYHFGFISKYSQCTIIALTIGKGVINQSIALNFACKIYISNNINYQTSNQIYIQCTHMKSYASKIYFPYIIRQKNLEYSYNMFIMTKYMLIKEYLFIKLIFGNLVIK